MDNLLYQGVAVASSCHGDGICGKCHMRVESALPLPPMGELEQNTLHRNKLDSDQRLSCQLYLASDCQVSTTYW
jgi:ferredoxin, 2Fe-2S